MKSLNKDASCYRNLNNPSCIDMILPNSPRSFFITEAYFTGASNCYRLVSYAFKTTSFRTQSKEMMYRIFKIFDKEIFNQEFATS